MLNSSETLPLVEGILIPLPPVHSRVNDENDPHHILKKKLASQSWGGVSLNITYNVASALLTPWLIYRITMSYAQKNYSFKLLPSCQTLNFKNMTHKLVDQIARNVIFELDHKRERFLADPANRAAQITFQTADGVALDLLKIMNANNQNRWIVFFQGNSSCYEKHLEELQKISLLTGANILLGNYRGVGRSEGKPLCSDNLVLDGTAMVQYLKEQENVPTRHILLHGWSMGGAIAAAVASYYQEPGNEIAVISDRSFTTLQAVIMTMYPFPVATTLASFSYAGGWNFNSVEKFNKLNIHRVVVIYSKDDPTVPYVSSLYKGFKQSHMTEEDIIAKMNRSSNKGDEESAPLLFRTARYKPMNIKILRSHLPESSSSHTVYLSELGDIFPQYIAKVKELLKLV